MDLRAEESKMAVKETPPLSAPHFCSFHVVEALRDLERLYSRRLRRSQRLKVSRQIVCNLSGRVAQEEKQEAEPGVGALPPRVWSFSLHVWFYSDLISHLNVWLDEHSGVSCRGARTSTKQIN